MSASKIPPRTLVFIKNVSSFMEFHKNIAIINMYIYVCVCVCIKDYFSIKKKSNSMTKQTFAIIPCTDYRNDLKQLKNILLVDHKIYVKLCKEKKNIYEVMKIINFFFQKFSCCIHNMNDFQLNIISILKI